MFACFLARARGPQRRHKITHMFELERGRERKRGKKGKTRVLSVSVSFRPFVCVSLDQGYTNRRIPLLKLTSSITVHITCVTLHSTLTMQGFTSAVRRAVTRPEVPIAVHCSAGVGRTGTYFTGTPLHFKPF